MALRRFGFVVRLLSVSLSFVSWSSTQVQNGQFAGVVTDPTGAAIANAKVTVSNPSQNFTDTTATNQSGLYNLKELPVGTYKITVEAPGFKTVSNIGVSVNAGTVVHLDLKMQVGQTHEIVEVSGEAAAVNTEDSKMATIVGSTQIANLPLNGRNVYDLMQLAAGAVNVAGVDFENGHNTVVNGIRENFNGFLINGINNKDLSGGVTNTPNEKTVQAFQPPTLNNSPTSASTPRSVQPSATTP